MTKEMKDLIHKKGFKSKVSAHPCPGELALAYRLPGSIDDVRKKEENFTEVNEDMLVELAIRQNGICAGQYPYKKVSVGKLFLEETGGGYLSRRAVYGNGGL